MARSGLARAGFQQPARAEIGRIRVGEVQRGALLAKGGRARTYLVPPPLPSNGLQTSLA